MSINLTAKEKMKALSLIPVLPPNSSLKKCLDLMTEKKLGITCFTDETGKLVGLLTDGDLRRLLLTKQSPLPALLVADGMIFGNSNPKVGYIDDEISMLQQVMNDKQIWDLPIVDSKGVLLGLLHRHDASQ
jgi:CBS domain-containing protein